MEMSFTEAQRDMRRGYCSGGPGILASAIVWACAAGTAAIASAHAAVWTLLIGGVLIFPVSILVCKLLGARGAHSKGNPLGALAGTSTFWLVFAIAIALVLSGHKQAWFFSAMLLTIGGRYLIFATAYGMGHYWVLGLALAVGGVVTFALVVRIIRELQGLSQTQLSSLCGIPQTTISSIETVRVNLGVERAKVLATSLHCHPAVLVFPGWQLEFVA